jgi:hypothetical protein
VSTFITELIPFIKLLAKLSESSSISHLNDSKSLTQSGKYCTHGLRLATLGPARTGLVVPRIKIDMRVTDTLCNKSLQEQSGNNGAGKRFR